SPDWRILLVALPIRGVTGRTPIGIEFCATLRVGLRDVQLQLGDRAGTGRTCAVHLDALIGRQPGNVRCNRNGDFTPQWWTDTVAAPHEAVQDAVFKRDDRLFTRRPCRISGRDADERR